MTPDCFANNDMIGSLEKYEAQIYTVESHRQCYIDNSLEIKLEFTTENESCRKL